MAYLSGYSKYKVLTLTGGASGAQTAFQLKIAVSKEAAMQGDFDDLRFTQADGTTLVDAWAELIVTDTSATVWVEFPTTPANTVEQIYRMYYGNAGASNYWAIGATFLLGDDFPGSSLDGAKWTAELKGTGTAVSVTGGECKLDVPDNQSCSANIKSIATFTKDIAIHIKRKCPTDTEYLHCSLGSGVLCDNAGGSANWWFTFLKSGYALNFQDSGANDIIEMPASGSMTFLTSPDFAFDPSSYANCEFRYYGAAGNLEWLIDDVSKSSTTDTTFLNDNKNLLITQGAYSASGRGADQYIDWAFVRKYVANPPTYAFGAEQSVPTGNPYWYYNLLKRRN